MAKRAMHIRKWVRWVAPNAIWDFVKWIGGSSVLTSIGHACWLEFHRTPVDWYWFAALFFGGLLLVVIGVWRERKAPADLPSSPVVDPPMASPSKLIVDSAYYGIEGGADEEVSDKYLRPRIRGDALVGWIGADLFGAYQPVFGRKRLKVCYSFQGKKATIVRQEDELLVLPEDPHLKELDGVLDQLQRDALRYVKELMRFVDEEVKSFPDQGDPTKLSSKEMDERLDKRRAWTIRVEATYKGRFEPTENDLDLRFQQRSIRVIRIPSMPGYQLIQFRLRDTAAAIVSAVHELDGIHVRVKVQ